MQSTLSFTAVTFREISSTAALTKLLLAIEIHVTTAALSPPLPVRGRESSRSSTLPPIIHGLEVVLELPWSFYVKSGGGVLKTGHATCALVQCPKLYAHTSRIAEMESQPLSRCIHFLQFVEESLQTMYLVQFQ